MQKYLKCLKRFHDVLFQKDQFKCVCFAGCNIQGHVISSLQMKSEHYAQTKDETYFLKQLFKKEKYDNSS